MINYPKRLIEVDLPIKRISEHARREKSIRHGHISTLHIWWARRPLAACRAVICAALWPDPAGPLCPDAFRRIARAEMQKWATQRIGLLGEESYKRFINFQKNAKKLDDNEILRGALLDFIADFANWDNSTVKEYLETSRVLTQAAHEALGGEPGTRPLVVDPFAGGGSIPLEALRVGADAFASDLNPVAVLLNKAVLEYIPKYGQRLADEVRKWGEWIREEAEKQLAGFYPKDADGSTPIAYLWARTITCEGPTCGATIPLVRSLWLANKGKKSVALGIVKRPKLKKIEFEIIENVKPRDVGGGTVRKGSVSCPLCGYTTPIESVRRQLKLRAGGTTDAFLVAVVTLSKTTQGRSYRLPKQADLEATRLAQNELQKRIRSHKSELSLVPNEHFSGLEPRRIPLPQYGMDNFGSLFTPRQALALTTLAALVQEVGRRTKDDVDKTFVAAVQTCLAFAVDRQADKLASLCVWNFITQNVEHVFGRQALPMVWDFVEGSIFGGSSADWETILSYILEYIEYQSGVAPAGSGQSLCTSATKQPLPNGSGNLVFTDPPYYYSIPYSDLSDYFYVWLRRSLGNVHVDLFGSQTTLKEEEIVQNLPHSKVAHLQKDRAFYESHMQMALEECRRVEKAEGIACIVFAHTETEAWEALVSAMIGAGWRVTASWPIDTERAGRIIAQRQSTLASSVHLVCRPRSIAESDTRSEQVGDWREVLSELPKRIHEWMPRLAHEGVVGADAIFACLGPALEIFSRYSRVEKASGEQVMLKEYLEEVWAAVAKEALNMIFEGGDAIGFEEDARVTAIWLWTLRTEIRNGAQEDGNDQGSLDEEDDDDSKKKSLGGYVLEYDAARKIAQGLGAHLERLESLVEVKGEKARLLPVEERARYLFGKDSIETVSKKKKKDHQMTMFEIVEEVDETKSRSGNKKAAAEFVGTVLDRVHQSMLLFATGRAEALRRFLVEDGVGRDQRFWKLAQSLSALYPKDSDEKRWVDGLLARKKGLGF